MGRDLGELKPGRNAKESFMSHRMEIIGLDLKTTFKRSEELTLAACEPLEIVDLLCGVYGVLLIS